MCLYLTWLWVGELLAAGVGPCIHLVEKGFFLPLCLPQAIQSCSSGWSYLCFIARCRRTGFTEETSVLCIFLWL